MGGADTENCLRTPARHPWLSRNMKFTTTIPSHCNALNMLKDLKVAIVELIIIRVCNRELRYDCVVSESPLPCLRYLGT